MHKETVRGALLVLAASLIFGAMPSLIMDAYSGGISVLTMQSLKYITVSAILIPFSIKVYALHRMSKPLLLKIVAVSGVLYAAQAALYAYAVTIMPVSVAALLLFSYPLLVSLISVLFGWERLSASGILLLLISFGGLVLMFSEGSQGVSLVGVLCSLLAALSYSVYVIIISRVSGDLPAPVINTLVNAGPAITLTVTAVAAGSFSLQFAPFCWWYVLLNAVLGGVVAYIMWFTGMKLLGAVGASALSMTEPAFAAMASLVLLGQQMKPMELVGGCILLAGTTVFTYLRSNRPQTPAESAAPTA